MIYYIHDVPGRVRIRTPVMRGDAVRAGVVRDFVLSLPGVQSVHIRSLTGSILIFYDPARTDVDRLFHSLSARGLIFPRIHSPSPPRLRAVARIAD